MAACPEYSGYNTHRHPPPAPTKEEKQCKSEVSDFMHRFTGFENRIGLMSHRMNVSSKTSSSFEAGMFFSEAYFLIKRHESHLSVTQAKALEDVSATCLKLVQQITTTMEPGGGSISM